jgi:hypothetical protein
VTGPTGAIGNTGPTGQTGTTGSSTTIFGNTGTPLSGTGSIGDFYIDFSTGWLWKKV